MSLGFQNFRGTLVNQGLSRSESLCNDFRGTALVPVRLPTEIRFILAGLWTSDSKQYERFKFNGFLKDRDCNVWVIFLLSYLCFESGTLSSFIIPERIQL